jgi:hypothetical protein
MTPRELRQSAPREAVHHRLPVGFAALALATIMFGATLGAMSFFWTAPDDVSRSVIAATTGAPSASIPNPAAAFDDSWEDADIRACGEEANAAAKAASKRKLLSVSNDRVGLGGPDPDMVERTTYLLCNIETKPRHLCKAYWRANLIDAIKTHAADFHKVTQSAYWAKVDLARQTRMAEGIDPSSVKSLSDDLDVTTREVARMHGDISAALQRLVENGIVKRDAFGAFLGYGIPPAIAEMLGDARPTRHLCR